MYVRFIVAIGTRPVRKQMGIIHEAFYLRSDGVFEDYERVLVDTAIDWFNRELPVPPFLSRRWSMNSVCWFRDSARTMIDVCRDLAVVLEQHGRTVRMLRTCRPGMIRYEDRYQIVAQDRRF